MNETGTGKTIDISSVFEELSSSPSGLSSSEADQRIVRYGFNTVEEKQEGSFRKIFGYFWGPIPWMIEIAAVLSVIVHHIPDCIFITALLIFNASVAFFQEFQAGNAIEDLKKKLAIKARVCRDGKWQEILASELVPGDVVRIRAGDIIPADVVMTEGEYLSLDQSALTGESLPVDKMTGDTILSGSVVQKGEAVAVVRATGKESYFGKTIKLVANAQSISHFQKAVLRIGDFLIYLSLWLVGILFVVRLAKGDSFFELLKFALILTVASIPVALPAVLSVTMAVGALVLSRKKAIVTRLQSIEEMAGIDVLLCDKTGTLTRNELVMGNPALFDTASTEEIIVTAAWASGAENMDAIDRMILTASEKYQFPEGFHQTHFTPFDPVSKRTEAVIEDGKGHKIFVTKGAPQIVSVLCQPEKEIEKRILDSIETFAHKGYRTLGVARKEEGENWKFLGLIPLYDPIGEDTVATIGQAKDHGLLVKMVTGDNSAIAREIASEAGIGGNILDVRGEEMKNMSMEGIAEKACRADGFAQVFPENKYTVVRALQSKGYFVGMTGDGVNDAPALKQADLGIAVCNATDAARSAASLVLTVPGLSVIIGAVEEARRIFERMNSYAVYRITETIRIMIFIVLAIVTYNIYPVTALMIILLALLNDIPIMTIAYDRAPSARKPVKWDMRRVICTASILGGIGVIETFFLMTIGLIWLELPLDQLRSMIFLKLSVAGHLTLFIARTRGAFFQKPFPAPVVLIAILGTQLIAALIVGFGIFVAPLPWVYVGFVWGYCLLWMFIEDGAKLLFYRYLDLSQSHHKKFLSFVKEKIPPFLRNNHQK